MTDNELLLAISDMIDQKFKSELRPIKNDIQDMKNDLLDTKNDLLVTKSDLLDTKNEVHQIKLYLENLIAPRLDTIESCYTDTYNRYKNYSDKMQATFDDIDVMKKVLLEHSEKLQKIS